MGGNQNSPVLALSVLSTKHPHTHFCPVLSTLLTGFGLSGPGWVMEKKQPRVLETQLDKLIRHKLYTIRTSMKRQWRHKKENPRNLSHGFLWKERKEEEGGQEPHANWEGVGASLSDCSLWEKWVRGLSEANCFWDPARKFTRPCVAGHTALASWGTADPHQILPALTSASVSHLHSPYPTYSSGCHCS